MTPEETCAGLPDSIKSDVLELARDVEFMRGKLEETRNGLAKQQVVIAYDNGGGQTGIRENPAFKGYHQLLASYRKAFEELSSTLRRYGGLEKRAGDNPLDKILAEAEKVLADAG